MQKYLQGQDLHFLRAVNMSCMLVLKAPSWLRATAYGITASERKATAVGNP